MKIKQVIDHYGSKVEASRKLGVSRQLVQSWIVAGRIPPLAQIRIQKKTRGRLKADADVYNF